MNLQLRVIYEPAAQGHIWTCSSGSCMDLQFRVIHGPAVQGHILYLYPEKVTYQKRLFVFLFLMGNE